MNQRADGVDSYDIYCEVKGKLTEERKKYIENLRKENSENSKEWRQEVLFEQCILLMKFPQLTTLPESRENIDIDKWLEDLNIDVQDLYPLGNCNHLSDASYEIFYNVMHYWVYGPNPIAKDFYNVPEGFKGKGTILYFISIDLGQLKAGTGKIYKVGITTKPLVVGYAYAARYGKEYTDSIKILRQVSYDDGKDAYENERKVIKYRYSAAEEEKGRYSKAKKALTKKDFDTLGPTEWVFPGASEEKAIELFNYITNNMGVS